MPDYGQIPQRSWPVHSFPDRGFVGSPSGTPGQASKDDAVLLHQRPRYGWQLEHNSDAEVLSVVFMALQAMNTRRSRHR